MKQVKNFVVCKSYFGNNQPQIENEGFLWLMSDEIVVKVSR